jgi:ankyrin repeat protein
MFPNPQDALPLPPRPNLEQYKKRAKDLVKACKSGAPGAIGAWAAKWIETLVRLAGLTITPGVPVRIDRWADQLTEFARSKLSGSGRGSAKCALTDAQFVIARSHGFESWPKFAKHIEALARRSSPASQFEAAADAVIAGDVASLHRLLRENPELIRARSTREHNATLLHYISANGVEGYRQITPKNAVKIAKILLKAGAEVDAEADVYGGGATTLGLVATSIHPQRAGVQIPLMEILLEYGADMDHPTGAGNRDSLVKGCLANGRPQAAEFLASRGARLDLEEAAGVGRLDLVKGFFLADGSLKEGAPKNQMERAFVWACMCGRTAVADFLLQKGVDPAAGANTAQTGLHLAAHGGQLATVKLLIERKAPLEAMNVYGGTVLGQALWSAVNEPQADHVAIIETLLAAGAKMEDGSLAWLAQQEASPLLKERIAEVLRRHGAKS